jgi:hypothetical protein
MPHTVQTLPALDEHRAPGERMVVSAGADRGHGHDAGRRWTGSDCGRTSRAAARSCGRSRSRSPPDYALPVVWAGLNREAWGRCSARITCITALINARWVNACGKLPRCRPLCTSISSAYSSSGLA